MEELDLIKEILPAYSNRKTTTDYWKIIENFLIKKYQDKGERGILELEDNIKMINSASIGLGGIIKHFKSDMDIK